jgi:hypothetical protein
MLITIVVVMRMKSMKNYRIATVIQFKPVFLTHHPYRYKPGNVATTTTMFNTRQYSRSRTPKMSITNAAEHVVYIVRYIPDADPAAGGIFIAIKAGLKIEPVPIPTQAPQNAPKKATQIILTEFFTVHSKSPSTKTYYASFFSLYSGNKIL